MQNSMWKMATLLGVIGVGCLVVLQLQKGLPNGQTALAGLKPAGEAVPKAQDETTDPFAFDGFSEKPETPLDPFTPGQGQSEPEAEFGTGSAFEDESAAVAKPAGFAEVFGHQSEPGSTGGVTPAGATHVTSTPVAQEEPAFGEDLFGDGTSAAGNASPETPAQDTEDPFGVPTTEPSPFNPEPGADVALQATPAAGPLDALEPASASTAPELDPFGDTNPSKSGTTSHTAQDPWVADSVGSSSTDRPPQTLPAPEEFGREQPIDELFPRDTSQEDGSPAVTAEAPSLGSSRVDLTTGPALPKPAPLDDWQDEPTVATLPSPPDQRDPFGTGPDQQLRPLDPAPDELSPGPLGFDQFDPKTPAAEPSVLPLSAAPHEPVPVPLEADAKSAAAQHYPDASKGEPRQEFGQFNPIQPVASTRPAPSFDSVPHGTLKPQLRIAKSAPGTGAIGKPLIYSIKIRNVGNAVADDVVVEDYIPQGARLTGTIPQAELINDRLTWRFARLEPNQEQEIKIRVVPEKEGQIGSVATVRMKTEIGSRTTITAPKLKLELHTQKDAKVGETIVLRYRITNNGTGDATKVMLQHALPPQLQHSMGADLAYDVGDLAAGASKDVTLQLVAAKAGEARNTAVVTAEGGITDRANTSVSILGAQLKVTRRGPARRYLNRVATYENTVTNTTHRDSDPATLIEHVPEGMEYVGSNGGQYSPLKRTVAWSVPAIRSGEQLAFSVQLKPIAAGSHESLVQVVEQTGFKSRTNSRTQVVHLNNMGLDLSQLDGPLEVGEKVVFTIDVRNRGTSAATNSVLEVQIPAELRVLEAGPVQAKFIENNIAQFDAIPEIRAGGQKRFQIALIAERAASDVRLRATIRSDQMPQRLLKEESITVFEDGSN